MEVGTSKHRKPWIAALLSLLFTGLGQTYCGQWRLGLVLFSVESILGFVSIAGMGSFAFLVISIGVLVCFNVAVAIHAYRVARGSKGYTLHPCNRWWVYGAFMAATIVIGVATEGIGEQQWFQTYKIPSGSMLHTLQIGDHLIAESLSESDILNRGDIIIFSEPGSGRNYVKRLIGMPGERVEIKAKVLYINGERQDEPYVIHTKDEYSAKRDDWGPQTIKPSTFFVMGDNRDASYDSRWLGAIDRERITKRALYIYFPGDVGSHEWMSRFGMPLR